MNKESHVWQREDLAKLFLEDVRGGIPLAAEQIDVLLRLMMDEGPGGGHYENIVNQRFRRVGVGLVYAGGRLYLTNDFSD